jgi:hypothetical protein
MEQSYQTSVDEPTSATRERLSGRRATLRLTPRAIGVIVFIAILLINGVAYGAVWGYGAYTTQKSARADLDVRLADLQALNAAGKLFTTAGLGQARDDLVAVDHDLAQLRTLLPLGSLSAVEPEATIYHTISLGRDVVGAALAGLRAEQTLSPALSALVGSVTHNTTTTGRPMTLEDVTHGQQALAVIINDWAAAQADRQAISPGALRSLGDPRLDKILTTFDKYAPMVTVGINMASAALDWSPAALGLTQQFNILLFNMDTDELRATGGFLGNYAQITLSRGVVTSGIHLHDIYTLDCPNSVCQKRALPPGYSWFPLAQGEFGLRDSNLNPDFPTAGGLAASLYQQMTGERIDVVVAITPAIIEDIMRVTGPLTVPQFHVTVTADTLAATIHYYHQNPSLTTRLGVNYRALGTSAAKAFDVLVSQALMAQVSRLSGSQLGQLGKLLASAFMTKDIQLFVSDTRVEQTLQQAGIAGQVLAPAYDNLMLVDENDGASYANADMRETASDVVALDASGAATHTLTVTYNYVVVKHSYAQQSVYEDFVRVITPGTVGAIKVKGPCALGKTIQSFHAVVGCQLRVNRGQKVTVTFTWTVPNAFTAGKPSAYRLLIQRQAGAQVDTSVKLTPTGGQTLSAQGGALQPQPGGLTWSSSPQLDNTTLSALVTP